MAHLSVGLIQSKVFFEAEKAKEILGAAGYEAFTVRTFMLPFDGVYLTELLRVYIAVKGIETYENMKDMTAEQLGELFKTYVGNSKSEE